MFDHFLELILALAVFESIYIQNKGLNSVCMIHILGLNLVRCNDCH